MGYGTSLNNIYSMEKEIIKDWNYIKNTFEGKSYLTKEDIDKIDKSIKRKLREKKLERIYNEKEPSI